MRSMACCVQPPFLPEISRESRSHPGGMACLLAALVPTASDPPPRGQSHNGCSGRRTVQCRGCFRMGAATVQSAGKSDGNARD